MLTVTRTISDPASASSMHCCAVAARIRRVGHRHRLHDDGRAAADLDGADADADRLVELHECHWNTRSYHPNWAGWPSD